MAEWVIGLIIMVYLLTLDFTLLRRLGYSNLFSILYSLPLFLFYPIAMLVLLCLRWPIHREIRDLRVRYGEGVEDDAYYLLEEAIRFEAKVKYEEALIKYQEVLTRFRNTTSGKDAEIAVEALRPKVLEEQQEQFNQQ